MTEEHHRILMSHLAYLSNRSFVFEDYTWSHTPFPWTIYDFALRPKRIPLNAFISGPTAGGPLSLDDLSSSVTYPTFPPPERQRQHVQYPSPRAISAEEWYNTVCPKHKRVTIPSKGAPTGDITIEGNEVMEWWVRRLSEYADESCVEIGLVEGEPIFDK